MCFSAVVIARSRCGGLHFQLGFVVGWKVNKVQNVNSEESTHTQCVKSVFLENIFQLATWTLNVKYWLRTTVLTRWSTQNQTQLKRENKIECGNFNRRCSQVLIWVLTWVPLPFRECLNVRTGTYFPLVTAKCCAPVGRAAVKPAQSGGCGSPRIAGNPGSGVGTADLDNFRGLFLLLTCQVGYLGKL